MELFEVFESFMVICPMLKLLGICLQTSVSSEENLDGKLFIQFVALIFLWYIKKAMSDNDMFKNYII